MEGMPEWNFYLGSRPTCASALTAGFADTQRTVRGARPPFEPRPAVPVEPVTRRAVGGCRHGRPGQAGPGETTSSPETAGK
jgi:hypothetical protein